MSEVWLIGMAAIMAGGMARGQWTALPEAPIKAKPEHQVAWLGDRLLVWGYFSNQADGAMYSPHTRQWERLVQSPWHPRDGFHTVWTGKKLIVWGGTDHQGQSRVDGMVWDPARRISEPIPPAPFDGRITAWQTEVVWTGKALVVWGGWNRQEREPVGALYQVSTGQWEVLPRAPLAGRRQYAMAWTGTEVVIWGGLGGLGSEGGGARYNPRTKQWTALPETDFLLHRVPKINRTYGRYGLSAVWTGASVIFWGGASHQGTKFNDGASYNPKTDEWEKVPAAPIDARAWHQAVWTNKGMMVFGGMGSSDKVDGAVYDPGKQAWETLPPAPVQSLASQGKVRLVWTGSSLIVWGWPQGAAWRFQ